MLKAVILLGGPQKGTRFRPLSFDLPKPLFPVSGLPIVQHHIEACLRIPNLKEILLLGYYPASEMASFVAEMSQEYKISIRYLQEYSCLGTAGGIYHFRDQIRRGNPEAFFVLNGDVCADFPLAEMLEFHQNRANNNIVTIMATEATRQQSMHYGCIVENKTTHEVQHYVEKPSTFVSNLINCGVYIFSLEVFQRMAAVFYEKQQEYNDTSSVDKENSEREAIYLEQEILMPLAGTGKAHVYQTTKWWSQLKTPGAAIYANRHYLQLYKDRCPNRLATGEGIIGDVFIHPSANVHPTALLGPNVSIGKGATVRAGARIKESIVLGESDVREHALIMHSIIGWNSTVGAWTRVEGTPCDPNPDKAFAKMDNAPLFNNDGRLNPSITILGCNVTVPEEVIVLNSIVLPHKELTRSFKNEIIL